MADFLITGEGGDQDGGGASMSLVPAPPAFTMIGEGGDQDGGAAPMAVVGSVTMTPEGGDADGGHSPMHFYPFTPPTPRGRFMFFGSGPMDPTFSRRVFMNPTRYLYNRIGAALAADTLSLDDDTNLAIGLAKNNITPGLDLVIGDIVEADFNTYARKNCTPPAVVYTDPATGEIILRVAPPVGGLVWSPGSGANLPQTIYAYFLFAVDNAELLAAARLEAPIILTTTGQIVEVPVAEFRLKLSALT